MPKSDNYRPGWELDYEFGAGECGTLPEELTRITHKSIANSIH